ncbi:inorganic pyrophosphatase [Aaosphaeria arxii CBS 175.79]|uniref:inorganic diphosphatase n=1 Tax=Aaosphaeria arxii CBS 175.79 TaxID=1450172 RepID=A0A6A5XH31_9PLEO|nr:inorganic pyrophosphatase [Aaosphaeria arxii CBS 175.79]KAF2012220.1 inorganic pyrophosphatase [Aaosphaeria arxii CBS 175.79]
MVAKNILFTLACAAAVAATPAPSKDKPPKVPKECATFDYEKLSLREVGARNTLDWRIWLELNGEVISFWHDVPIYPDEKNKNVVSMVVEIPRWTDAKIETRRPEPFNPIFHDDKKEKPRFVESVWPHKSYPFLYGSIPQTWENPNVKHNFTNFVGDKDPMDVIDISETNGYVGQVRKVKVLGGIAMADSEETDWKVLAIDVNDPLAPLVNDFKDLEKYRPNLTQQVYDWFTYYKVPRGDPVNPIIGDKWQDASFIVETIEESNRYWQDLVSGKEDPGKIRIEQTSNPDLKSWVSCKDAHKKYDVPKKSKVKDAAPRPEQYDHWYYLDANKNLIQLPASS